MSQINQASHEIPQDTQLHEQVQKNTPETSALDDFFKNRDRPLDQLDPEEPEVQIQQKKESIEEDGENIVKDQPDKKDLKKISDANTDKEMPDKDNDFDRLKKRLDDSTNYSFSLRKNRDSALSYIDKLIDDGDLSSDQANELISILKSKGPKEPEGLSGSQKNEKINHPFQKFFDIANQDVVESYLEVTEDKRFHDKVRSFDAFMSEASKEELESLYQELSEVENKPIGLLKKILAVGEDYLGKGYEEFLKSGGFRKYNEIKDNEIKVLKDKFDKLQRKMSKYEQYDTQSFNLEESNLSPFEERNTGDTFGDYFAKRDAVKRR